MAVTYSLKYQARVLVALPCDTISSKWLVGTTALREENEVGVGREGADNTHGVAHALVNADGCTHYPQPDVLRGLRSQTQANACLTVWGAVIKPGAARDHRPRG